MASEPQGLMPGWRGGALLADPSYKTAQIPGMRGGGVGTLAGWRGGPFSQHQTYRNRLFPWQPGGFREPGCFDLLPGWRGGAYPELDYIKTNNITWYPPNHHQICHLYTINVGKVLHHSTLSLDAVIVSKHHAVLIRSMLGNCSTTPPSTWLAAQRA